MRLWLVAVMSLALCSAAVAAERVALRVTAMSGTVEGADPRVFDKGLEDVREAVADLQYDTYRKLVVKDLDAEYGEEAKIPIDDRYTLYLTPDEKDARNRIRFHVRIEERLPGEPERKVNAVKTTITAVPGHKIKFHGLDLDEGKLVVVLSVKG